MSAITTMTELMDEVSQLRKKLATAKQQLATVTAERDALARENLQAFNQLDALRLAAQHHEEGLP